jgi:hypothetical protein
MTDQNPATNASILGAYRAELISVGIDDPDELALLVRDAAASLLRGECEMRVVPKPAPMAAHLKTIEDFCEMLAAFAPLKFVIP